MKMPTNVATVTCHSRRPCIPWVRFVPSGSGNPVAQHMHEPHCEVDGPRLQRTM